MSFQSNPLSLSVPEPAFESWLRDSGYLELLDHRTTQLHHLHSTTITTTVPSTAPPPQQPPSRTTTTTTLTTLIYTLIMSQISSLATFLSVFSVNPFAKLNSSDFSGRDDQDGILSLRNWTKGGFIGDLGSYSYPFSPSQAKMRVFENVKRFARHYAVLSMVFFACSLYQLPLALIGLLSCLGLWELFRFCDAKWTLERFPSSRQVLIRVFQCAVAAILFLCNVQAAVFWTVAVSYAVLIMHASFRKLTPANAKQPLKGRGR